MGEAFIPRAPGRLQGLWAVNKHLVAQVQRLRCQRRATLDMDATLVETGKGEALWSYQGTRAYQPLQTYWVESFPGRTDPYRVPGRERARGL